MTGTPEGDALRDAITSPGDPLNRWTVGKGDPYRLDTPSNHRDAAWLADQLASIPVSRIHLRGLHYAVLGRRLPSGATYENTDAAWTWLSEQAASAARWLGYIPWHRITDERHDPPEHPEAEHFGEPDVPEHGVYLAAPTRLAALDWSPRAGFTMEAHARLPRPVQPYRLALFGEKSSLRGILRPLAERYRASLYLPTGEPSATMIHDLASRHDGRPLIVLYVADADPAGWQMPVSVARKLQAFRTTTHPELEFDVRRVALTPEHVRAFGLPSTPLKATERRADAWTAAMGVEQTEVDALAISQPDVLRGLVSRALGEFYDATLDARHREAETAYLAAVRAALGERSEEFAEERAEAARLLAEMQERDDALGALYAAASARARAIRLEHVEPPEPVLPAVRGPSSPPLIASAWPWERQTRALLASRNYESEG